MIPWTGNEDYAGNFSLASDHLGAALYRGELALCLGAGISRPLGLPAWYTLVKDCMEKAGLPHDYISESTDILTLQAAAGQVRQKINDDVRFKNLVSEALYSSAKTRSPANVTPLMTALGALMMGSRRGRVKEVWTLNFDDFIEWYLRINGFVTQVVTEVPSLLRDVDVAVYHPHGFLPLDSHHGIISERIVFDDTSYAQHRFGTDKGMLEATRNLIGSKIILAIGLGWSADTFQELIMATAETIKNRPTAFWFFGPPKSGDVAAKEKLDRDKAACLTHNVVPLQFGHHDEYTPFILNICEKAMSSLTL
jgi:hypothetical protein